MNVRRLTRFEEHEIIIVEAAREPFQRGNETGVLDMGADKTGGLDILSPQETDNRQADDHSRLPRRSAATPKAVTMHTRERQESGGGNEQQRPGRMTSTNRRASQKCSGNIRSL